LTIPSWIRDISIAPYSAEAKASCGKGDVLMWSDNLRTLWGRDLRHWLGILKTITTIKVTAQR
jgi:hypothetical protein